MFRSEFGKGLLAMVSGTAIAQVINFLFSMVLSRIYSPEDFGFVAVFSSIVSFILVASCGKFDVAIVAVKERDEAKRLFSLSFLITIGVSLASLVCAGVLFLISIDYSTSVVPGWHLTWFPTPSWVLWIPLSVFMLTAAQIIWMWFVREKQFKSLAWIRVVEALAFNGFAILLKGMSATGLFLGTLISQAVSVLTLSFLFSKKEKLSGFTFSRNALQQTFKANAEFPRVNILQGFLDIFQLNAVVLFCSGYFSQTHIGFYALCMRVLQVPMRLIILPVSHVFFSRASEIHREGGDLRGLVLQTIRHTALFSAPVSLALGFAGPWLFSLVFGEEWREAGVYAQILSAWIFLDLIRAPIVQIASIVGKQKLVLYVSVISNILLVISLFTGTHYCQDLRWTLGLIAFSQGVMTVILILLIIGMSKRK